MIVPECGKDVKNGINSLVGNKASYRE